MKEIAALSRILMHATPSSNAAFGECLPLSKTDEWAAASRGLIAGLPEGGITGPAIRQKLEQRAVFLKDILMPFAGENVSGTALTEYTLTFVLSGSGLKNTAADEDELRKNLEVSEA